MPPIAPKAGWEHFSHGSDIGVRGFGETVEEAFEQATVALSAVVADVSAIRQSEAVKVCCSAPDLEILFMSWLNTVIYEMAVRRMPFSKFRVVLIRTRSDRGVAEEAPGAYKDVNAVAEAAEQPRLARRVARLVPLICVKG